MAPASLSASPDRPPRLSTAYPKAPCVGGADVYLATGYKELFEKRAVSIIHPDPAQCGGILESKKISDLAT